MNIATMVNRDIPQWFRPFHDALVEAGLTTHVDAHTSNVVLILLDVCVKRGIQFHATERGLTVQHVNAPQPLPAPTQGMVEVLTGIAQTNEPSGTSGVYTDPAQRLYEGTFLVHD